MQIASEMYPSGMITVHYGAEAKIGFTCHVATKYCEKLGIEPVQCKVASYLYPSCRVIAGNNEV